ncbi:type III-B CRISPR module-associated protein Cmr5 [Numidum massiliense]|uniref:type III-B CRISPR module-associated protein Cmr5 n=1 Tax=Numidum massiliense TaxID=1522315 RepID=UPI0006D59A05|nr:type III-B CRISPR module-associated protein Cmr5 [Numidum massiliense]
MTNVNESIAKIEGGRAAFAFDEVAQSVRDGRIDGKKYRAYVKKMPSLIQVNGLGQTLAFYFSKRKRSGEGKIYDEIYQSVAKWLEQKFPEYFREQPDREAYKLIKTVINLKSKDYRFVTMETLAFLNWMRKFADGMVTDDE